MEKVLQSFQTGGGMLWKALWALVFGYMISAGIQVIVSRKQMAKVLGERGAKQVGLAAFFGFISSSCSFAALAASRSVYVKGAHPSNALAFLIASTNLVIELGIVLYILLGWHFLLGNILVGLLMALYSYGLTRVWLPDKWAAHARDHAEKQLDRDEGDAHDAAEGMPWKEALSSRRGWKAIADSFFMEWRMVWKEILFGFTVAGFLSTLVPKRFWDALLLGGGAKDVSFLVVLENVVVAPVIAFFTFIGSMGNVPLAAMLWSKGASFGGVMSFLGADLVAATVIYIHAKYYGWRYAAYMSAVMYVCMAAAGLTVHYIFAVANVIPTQRKAIEEMVAFKIDYTFWLNLVFIAISLILVWFHFKGPKERSPDA